jgi:hypothetical protein
MKKLIRLLQKYNAVTGYMHEITIHDNGECVLDPCIGNMSMIHTFSSVKKLKKHLKKSIK